MNEKIGIGIVVVVAIVAVAMFSGCVEKEEAPMPTLTPTPTPSPTPTPVVTPTPTPSPTPSPSMSIEEIKSKAREYNFIKNDNYDDLIRFNEEYVGEILTPVNIFCVHQVVRESKDNYHLLLLTWDADIVWVNYEGQRLLKGDWVDVWGEVKGLRTYKTVRGDGNTVPEVDALHLELNETVKKSLGECPFRW